jgi:hypothetical protein
VKVVFVCRLVFFSKLKNQRFQEGSLRHNLSAIVEIEGLFESTALFDSL